MKVLGIVLPILLSSFTITHGKKKLGFPKGGNSGGGIPVYYDSGAGLNHGPDCDDQVTYKTVPSIVVPASSVTYNVAPAGGGMTMSKKGGKKESGLSYTDVLGSLGKGLSFDKKEKDHHGGGGGSDTPVVYAANVQPVQYVVPVQPVQASHPKDDCYDSVPAVMPVSYKPVAPVSYGAVHVTAPVSYQKPVACETAPIGPSVSYAHSVGAVAYEPVSVGPSLSYPSAVGPSLSYPSTVGPSLSYPSAVSPSLSYPSAVSPVAYEPVSVGTVSYGVPMGTLVSYPKSVGPVAHGSVGHPVSYPHNVGHNVGHHVGMGHHSDCGHTYVTPSYSEVASPVVVVPSGHHHPSPGKLGLLGGNKHKGGHGGFYGHPQHTVSAYAPPSQGSYVLVSSGHSPHGYGHGRDC